VRVTHPFHPLAGQEFEFVKRRRNWRKDRVYFFDGDGELVSLPAEWTDVVAADPFVVVAAGRSPFHMSGLLELSELVAGLSLERASGGSAAVKQISPYLSKEFCRELGGRRIAGSSDLGRQGSL
jgi:hypothetical protein